MENEKKDPSHIRQTIKGKPLSIKTLLIRLLIVCVFAACAAAVAAFVFVKVMPVAQKMTGQVTPTPRVTIPVTEEPETTTPVPSTVTPTPVKTPSVTPEATKEPEDSVTPDVTKPAEPAQTQTPDDVSDQKGSENGSDQTKPDDKENKDDGEDKTELPAVPEDFTIEQYLKLQDDLLEIANNAEKSVVSVTAISSQMDYFNQSVENRQQISGVIIAQTDDAYYVLTESDIFNNIERIQVTFADGFIADAIYLKDDPDTGLAVVKVNADDISKETKENISAASLGNSYTIKTGDDVIALGMPNGYANSISFGKVTSTDNIISAYDCEYNLLATDISGTSDGSGILIDLNGCVVGIIDQSFAKSESQIVTCIPISQLKSLLELLSNGESRPYIGIKASEVTSGVSEITGIPKGVIITDVADESPAFFAGLSELDVITQIGEDKISNMTQYKNALWKATPGDTLPLIVLRKGAEGYTEIEFEITTGER